MNWASFISIVLYLFLYLPLVVVVAHSFNPSAGIVGSGTRLHWYRTALSDATVLSAVRITLLLAVFSTAISTALGTLLGYGIARHSFRGKRLFSRVMLIPIAVPDIVMAVSLLLFYALFRHLTGYLQLGFTTMLLAHVTFQIPFVALAVRARLRGMDPSLEEAASDLGASRLQRLWHVTLPLMRPGIVAGALMAFTLSLDDFVVSFFTSGPGSSTVPLYIYGAVKHGITGEIHALSSLLIAGAVLVTLALNRFQSRNDNRRDLSAARN